MSLFDIIGPVMIGPSSSHTCGAAKIGYFSRLLLGEEPKKAIIELHGSFATTGKGHGTDLAILAGILGIKWDNEKLTDSKRIAIQKGLNYRFKNTVLKNVHPNSARIYLYGNNFTVNIIGSSIGGGDIKIPFINDFNLDVDIKKSSIIMFYDDVPGIIAKTTALIAKKKINIAYLRSARSSSSGKAMMFIATDMKIDTDTTEQLNEIKHVKWVRVLRSIYEY